MFSSYHPHLLLWPSLNLAAGFAVLLPSPAGLQCFSPVHPGLWRRLSKSVVMMFFLLSSSPLASVPSAPCLRHRPTPPPFAFYCISSPFSSGARASSFGRFLTLFSLGVRRRRPLIRTPAVTRTDLLLESRSVWMIFLRSCAVTSTAAGCSVPVVLHSSPPQ